MNEENENQKVEVKKIQLYPTKVLVILHDKLTKKIFESTFEDLKEVSGIMENKKDNIVSPIEFDFSELDGVKKFSAFDKAVFNVCVSEQIHGNEYTTPAIIHRALGGNESRFSTEEKNKLLDSIRKLAKTWVRVDMKSYIEKYVKEYKGRNFKFEGAILPLKIVSTEIGGHVDETTIQFLGESPLAQIATLKKQFLKGDMGLLDVPKMKRTTRVVAIENYLVERVAIAQKSQRNKRSRIVGETSEGKPKFTRARKMNQSILLETLYEKCELQGSKPRQQQHDRDTISKVMNHLKECGKISDWTFEMDGKKYSKIVFS